MPDTNNSRTGKSTRNSAAASSSRDVSGKKKSSRREGSDNRSSSGSRSRRKGKTGITDSGTVRSATDDDKYGRMKAPSRSTYGDKRSEVSANWYKVPEQGITPIRELMSKAMREKPQVRPKESTSKATKPPPPPPPSKSKQSIDLAELRSKAADAALSRLDQSSRSVGFVKEKSSAASTDQLAVQSVLHVCPVVSSEVLHSRQWRPKIISYLSELARTEKVMSAVLTIHTLNMSKEKVDEAVQILTTYLKNIIANPEEEKYRAIKMTNKVFVEKVLPIKGAMEFLVAAGFRIEGRTEAEGSKIEVLCFPGTPDVSHLDMVVDALRSAEPLLPQVYRDPVVLRPREAEERVYLPDDFYDLTEKELTEMYKRNMEKLEEESPLMTKAMREKEERKHLAKYKYAVLRIRFPDAVYLQGTFGRLDTQKSIKDFVDSCLIRPFKYKLFPPLNKNPLLEINDDKTLLELKLVPSVVLNFVPEERDKFPKIYLAPNLVEKIKK